ncbi:GGDEF domain-containing protein, partial [Pseudomonas syringae pv. pisi str. 1704B]
VALGAHDDSLSLASQADTALYCAKHAGRNRVHSVLVDVPYHVVRTEIEA